MYLLPSLATWVWSLGPTQCRWKESLPSKLSFNLNLCIGSMCVPYNPNKHKEINVIFKSLWRLKKSRVRAGEMAPRLRVIAAHKEDLSKFGSQYPRWHLKNTYIQRQGIWCFLLASAVTCIHTHTTPSRPPRHVIKKKQNKILKTLKC